MTKILTILSGVPGSGKSTYAAKMKDTTVVSSDALRIELTGELQNFTKEIEVWTRFKQDIIDASFKVDSVVADATILTNNLRMHWFERFKGYFDEIHLVWFNLPFSVCWERNLRRKQPVPLDPCANMFRKFEKPNAEVEENFDKITEIKE